MDEGFDDVVGEREAIEGEAPKPASAPRRLAHALEPSMLRVRRRCAGIEKPIKLPWEVLNENHFGGGLWPGLHMLNAATGLGKTQVGMQAGAHAAKAGTPALYIGLELGELDLALRLLGTESGEKWSHLWTGKANAMSVAKADAAIPALSEWPFHYEIARPHGFPASDIRRAVEGMRATYPETDGHGSRPILVIVDFLQLVGDEPESEVDLRVRIARASYMLRACVNDFGVAVLCISSIARERIKLFSDVQDVARLVWEEDSAACGSPINRRVLEPDAVVGAGKESGEIEYAADSVSIMARVSDTADGYGADVAFVTAKGRATGATWSILHFTGFGYTEAEDGGAEVIAHWKDKGEKRERERKEKKSAKEQARSAAIVKDAAAVRAYVEANQGCGVNAARVHAVDDNRRRWAAAVAFLGADLVQTQVKPGARACLTFKGASK
jgi:replicative DNA helicase